MEGLLDFQDLCRRNPPQGYAYHVADTDQLTSAELIKGELISHLDETVRQIEAGSQRRIERIRIGKTFHYSTEEYTTRDWTHRCWEEIRGDPHRMVILGEFTREAVDRVWEKDFQTRSIKHEQFAIAMGQQLLYYYFFVRPDPRVVNETFTVGRAIQVRQQQQEDQQPQEGQPEERIFVVYMTFSYEQPAQAEEQPAQAEVTTPWDNSPDNSTDSCKY